MHGAGPPSPWFLGQRARLIASARRGPVLDLACGHGRHALAAAELGARMLAIDRDREALRSLRAEADRRRLRDLCGLCADLETSHGIPVKPNSCGAILVFRFLFRPLASAIAAALAPGGLLLYETFTVAQRALGSGPRRAAFLLEPGELPALFPDLEPIEHWEGQTEGPAPECLARLAARKRDD
jgi:SAM-dependent methyltransferase